MEKTINQVGDVEYDLEIHLTAEDLAGELNQALRKQRTQTSMKGFRPGKVPLALVKKMYGRAVAAELTEKKIQGIYEESVLNAGEHEVLGHPAITKLEYELDGDLQATVRFGVRPVIELKDLSSEHISKLVHPVSDEEIDEELENLRKREADLVPVEEDGIGETDQVVIDMQELDSESETPVIGKRDEDVTFFLDDDGVREELYSALLGLVSGASTRVMMSHESGDHEHTHLYEVTVKEVKRRELPELDDEFIKEYTEGKVEDLTTFRDNVEKQLVDMWERQSKNLFEGRIIDRMLELHPVPVPPSVVDMYLDAYVRELKQQSKGSLPENFDEQAYRAARRQEAEDQARWMLIRDAIVKKEELEVSEDDLNGYFEAQSGGSEEYSPSVLRQYYQAMNMIDGVKEQLLNKKVFEVLSDWFVVDEMDRDAYNEEMEKIREEGSAALESENEKETDPDASPKKKKTKKTKDTTIPESKTKLKEKAPSDVDKP